jgi:hypothetical protein
MRRKTPPVTSSQAPKRSSYLYLDAMCSDVWSLIFRMLLLCDVAVEMLQVVEAEFCETFKFAGDGAMTSTKALDLLR